MKKKQRRQLKEIVRRLPVGTPERNAVKEILSTVSNKKDKKIILAAFDGVL